MSGDRHLAPELLSGYLDGQLAAAERQRVENHLPGCDECRRRLEGLRTAIASLRSLERVAPPDELLADVRRRAAAETLSRPATAGWLGWLRWPVRHPGWAGAAAAALLAIATLAYRGLGTWALPPVPLPATAERGAERTMADARTGPRPAAPVVQPVAPAPPARQMKAPPGEEGVAGGVPGGVSGGVEGGVPGGVVGGVASGVGPSSPAAAPEPLGPAEVEEKIERTEKAPDAAPESAQLEARRDRAAHPAPAPLAKLGFAEELAAGGRRFVRDRLGWREAGIAADAVPALSVPVDGGAGRALLARLGDLRRRLGPGDRLLLYDGRRVIELRGPAAPERR